MSMKFALLFIAGLIFANGIPHFVNGISGKRFNLPPRGVRIGSAAVNVLWGWFNFVLATIVIGFAVGWDTETVISAASILFGVLVCALVLSKTFGDKKKKS